MFCVSCGNSYEFCNHCGHPLPSGVGQSVGEVASDKPVLVEVATVDAARETLENHNEGLTLAEPVPTPPPPSEVAPYARFTSLVLGAALLMSVLVFNIGHAFSRHRWEATISTIVAMVLAALLARSARGAWHRIIAVEPENDSLLRLRHRQILRKSAVIIVLLFASAAIVGIAIGQSRAEAVQLGADLQQLTTVGGRISKARSAVQATIASYVEMYKAIEPDVQELESIEGRLKTELGVFDGKFPSQHEETSKSIVGMDQGLRRMALLKQQIEIAKQIDALDPGKQFSVWKRQMLPLISKEEELDKAK